MNPEVPKISVIIPCYNLGQYVEEAIDSVLDQTIQNFEIIVVNDASPDEETNKILENLKKDKTTFVNTVQNRGLAGARNFGIDLSKGEYICCLDADDKLDPTYLEKAVKILDKDTKKEYGFVSAWLKHFGNEDWIWESSDYDPIRLAIENVVIVSSVFRREAYEKAGRYQKMYRAGYEDWNMWLSIVTNGYKWYCIKEPLFFYRKRGESMINDASKYQEILYKEIIEKNSKFYEENALDIIVRANSTLARSIDVNKMLELKIYYKDKDIENLNINFNYQKEYLEEVKRYNVKLESDVISLKDSMKKLYEQVDELNVLKKSKIFRLRETMIQESFGIKKLIKMSYLILGMITPEPLRKLVRK